MPDVITTAQLRALNVAIDLRFLNTFDSVPTFWEDLVTKVTSTGAGNVYPIRAAFPKMREWVGERHYHSLAVHSHFVMNKHYELTMSVNADDIKDLSYGGALIDAASLGERAKQAPDDLLVDMLQNGQNLAGYDGQSLFDTDHPVDVKSGTGTQVNYTSNGLALSATNWEFVRSRMAEFKDDQGQPIGARPTILLVPPQLEGTARRILEAEHDAIGATNINRGTARVIVIPKLANQGTVWYALDTGNTLKPFIFQERERVRLTMQTDAKDDNVFRFNRFDYGVDGRWALGTGVWFRIYKAVA